MRRALYLSHLKLALGQAPANEKAILRVPDEDSRAFEMLSLESLISGCGGVRRCHLGPGNWDLGSWVLLAFPRFLTNIAAANNSN